MNYSVRQNAVAPLALVMNVTPSAVIADLTDVSAASIAYVRQDGTSGTWSAVMSNQTADTLTLTHSWASGDVPNLETLHVWGVLTITGGDVPTTSVAIQVKAW